MSMTKDEARKELLETLEEYCHDKGYNLQVFAGMSDLVYTLYPLQKHMTNGDWIRSMSDEELADFIANNFDDCDCCVYAAEYADGRDDCMYPDDVVDCKKGHLAWLQQEHKSNSF
jgi:hypothetical protein